MSCASIRNELFIVLYSIILYYIILYYSGDSLPGSRKRRLDMDESPDSAERSDNQ